MVCPNCEQEVCIFNPSKQDIPPNTEFYFTCKPTAYEQMNGTPYDVSGIPLHEKPDKYYLWAVPFQRCIII